MQSLQVFVAAFCFIACAVSQLTSPPACGALCLKQAIAESPCLPTDRACICTNAQLTEIAEACVLTTCTIKESLSTKNYSMATCGVQARDDRWATLWLGMSFFILSIVAFALRMLARWICETGLYWDDYFMVAAIVTGVGFAVTSIPLYDHGLGQDIWSLSAHDITYMLVAYYHGEWVYQLAVFFTMISLLMFYLRIFPIQSVRIQVWIVMSAVSIYSVLGILVSINQCTPVHGAWEYWHGEEQFHCRNRNVLGWASAIIKMTLDIAIIAIPISPLANLDMSMKKKVQVMLMFAVGLFVTLVSILRLQSLVHFADSQNATWDYKAMGFWSQIEVHVGNICACMPGIYSLLKHFWPKIIGSKKDTTDPYTMESVKPSRKTQSRLRSEMDDDEENFTHFDGASRDSSSKGESYVNVTAHGTRMYDSS